MTKTNTNGRKSPEAVRAEILVCLKELFILCKTNKPFRISDQTRGVCSGTSLCSAILNLRVIERSGHVKGAGNIWEWKAGAPDTIVDVVYEAAKKVQAIYNNSRNNKGENAQKEEPTKPQAEELNENLAALIANIPQDLRQKIDETHEMVTYLYRQFTPIGTTLFPQTEIPKQ
jgi:hypothetical protein